MLRFIGLFFAAALILPSASFALDIDFEAGSGDPLVDFIAGPNCGKKVTEDASEGLGLGDMCPRNILGEDSESCNKAKTTCEEALKAKCDSECEAPVVTKNVCTKKGNKTEGYTCRADCAGTCGKKKDVAGI